MKHRLAEVARLLQHRAGGGCARSTPISIGGDVARVVSPTLAGQNQRVIEGVAAPASPLDKISICERLRLADILCQQILGGWRGQRPLQSRCCLPIPAGLPQSSHLPHNAARGASRISISLLASGRAILLTIRLASLARFIAQRDQRGNRFACSGIRPPLRPCRRGQRQIGRRGEQSRRAAPLRRSFISTIRAFQRFFCQSAASPARGDLFPVQRR